MIIKVFEEESQLDAFVGEYIIDFISKNKQPVIGFATGSTPLGVYNYFIEEYKKGNADFSKVTAFNLDEYVGVEKSHPLSFATAMKEALFSHINIQSENVHALNGAADNMDEECARYEKLIEDHPIDIQILGIGMDGHIAYNEPGSSLDGKCHVVDLFNESIESSLNYGFDDVNDVPRQGVTQGVGTIMRAKTLIMMAKGEKKAKLVERMLYGEVSSSFPSSVIQNHDNVIVVLDKAAAKYVKGE